VWSQRPSPWSIPHNRLEWVNHPDGFRRHYGYDGKSNLLSLIDENDHLTEYRYDELGRLRKVIQHIEEEEIATEYTYDGHDNLESVIDANGNRTEYVHDDFGRLAKQVSPDTGTTTYVYDEAGNLIEKTDAKGTVVTYTYDPLNRLGMVDFPEDPDIVYTYDDPSVSYGIGRLTGMNDSSGTYTFHYDPLGNIVREEKTIKGTLYTTEYRYDKGGLLTGLTYPSGRSIDYAFDDARRVRQVKTTKGARTKTVVKKISHLPFGPLRRLKYGNSTVLSEGYDLRYQLKTLEVKTTLDLEYERDGVGNIEAITDHLDPSRTQGFGYDDLDRLTRGEGIYGAIGYTYDHVGNRETKTVGEETETYTYKDGTNHLKSITGATTIAFDYDPNGNTEQMGTSRLSYNENNRLIEASMNEEVVGGYTYNSLGQRTIKKSSDGTTIYHYDLNGHLIAETKKNGKTITEYLYLGDRLLAMAPKGRSKLVYAHTDHLGTPIRMTDKKGGVVWQMDHRPFGEAEVDQDPDGDGKQVILNLRFRGQYYDSETGLHYNYFRDYHPGIGRYVEPDPIGLNTGINLYMYVYNSPVNWVDSVGLFTWPYTWKGWAGVILTGTGATTLFVPLPGARPIGLGLLALGGTLTIWDAVEGIQQSQDFGKDVGKRILRDRIKLYGKDPRKLQKRGIIPSNERLRELGFTDKDLKELGLLRESEQCK